MKYLEVEHILEIKHEIRNFPINLITVGPDDILNRVLKSYLDAKKKGSAY